MAKPDIHKLQQDILETGQANREIHDSLSIERTEFANERTFLAYLRTAMGLVLAGFSLVQFFHDQIYMWIGVLFVPFGIFLSLLGLKKFLIKKAHITRHRHAYKPISHLHAKIAEAQERFPEK